MKLFCMESFGAPVKLLIFPQVFIFKNARQFLGDFDFARVHLWGRWLTLKGEKINDSGVAIFTRTYTNSLGPSEDWGNIDEVLRNIRLLKKIPLHLWSLTHSGLNKSFKQFHKTINIQFRFAGGMCQKMSGERESDTHHGQHGHHGHQDHQLLVNQISASENHSCFGDLGLFSILRAGFFGFCSENIDFWSENIDD